MSRDGGGTSVKLLNAIPALPASDMARSVSFYCGKLGFAVGFQADDFAKLRRDGVELHLWLANDERWRGRAGECPVVSGAESFIAGTHSCRIEMNGVKELYDSIRLLGIVHPNGHIADMPWGTRDFGILDPDGNLITFFQRPTSLSE